MKSRKKRNKIQEIKDIDLRDIIFPEEIRELYKPNEELESDLETQILQTIKFMTSKIEDKYKPPKERNETFLCFPQQEFKYLILATYGDLEGIKTAYENIICRRTESEGLNLSLLTKSSVKRKKDIFTERICEAIYHPGKLQIERFQDFSSDLQAKLGDISKIDISKAAELSITKDIQIALMKDLMSRNKKHIDITRLMSYRFSERDDILIYPECLFNDDNGVNDSNSGMARFLFGFAVSHIGYFQHPQFGKWEEVAGRTIAKTGLQVIDEGMSYSCTDPEYQSQDLRLQMSIDILGMKNLILEYVRQLKKNERIQRTINIKDKTIETEKEKTARQRNKTSNMKKQVAELQKTVNDFKKTRMDETSELERTITAKVEERYEGMPARLKAAEKELVDYSKKIEYLESKIERTEEEMRTITKNPIIDSNNQQNRMYEEAMRQLKDLREYQANIKFRYFPNVATISNLDVWESVEEVRRDITTNTSVEEVGSKIGSSDNRTSVKSLQDICQKADSHYGTRCYSDEDRFFKVHKDGTKHVIIYAKKDDVYTFVWAGTHPQYDKQINHHTIRK